VPGDALHGTNPTASEQRVLALLPTDLSTPQIAQQLCLSTATVRSHIHRLYRRLGAHTRDEALQLAHQRGLLPGSPFAALCANDAVGEPGMDVTQV
jgi:LuxR family transcriptional regulator, maltose regulon positive regulatory protein